MVQRTTNLMKVILMIFALIFIPSFIIYYLFDFEIGIIFTIAISASILSAGLAGVENIIINKK